MNGPKIRGVMERYASLHRPEENKNRTVEISFASETPVARYFGTEILQISPESVRLERIRSNGAAIVDHDWRDVVGKPERVWIEGHKIRAEIRFGRSARAEEVYQDVLDGIRTGVSFRYEIHDIKEITRPGEDPTFLVTDFEPLEISFTAVPADFSVGVGRSLEPVDGRTGDFKEFTMDGPNIVNDKQESELKRLREEKEIYHVGRKFGVPEIAERAIQEGWSYKRMVDAALEARASNPPAPDNEIGMSEREISQFSVLRAINAGANPNDRKAQEEAAFEMEVSRAAADAIGKTPKGFIIPPDVLNNRFLVQNLGRRDMGTLSGPTGGYLVTEDFRGDQFVDLLRNGTLLMQLGTSLSSLQGDVAIPKQTGAGSASWILEGEDAPEQDHGVAQLTLSPRTIGNYTNIHRRLLKQASMDAENFTRMDLTAAIAEGIDMAGYNGIGGRSQPLGVLNYPGVQMVEGGDNGAAPDRGHLVEMISKLGNQNALGGNLAFVTNSLVRGKLLMTPEHPTANVGGWIWGKSNSKADGELVGFPSFVSNQVPSDLVKGSSSDCSAIIFGNWSDFVIGLWGSPEVIVDPYTKSTSGTVRVTVLQDVDMNIRRTQSFVVMKDAKA